ncbi:hypothetical protein CRUP_022045 [Coryphaenoides rupestris]|nr:hypothetical protein CRUP_022045 [Coryphaenoides rupestris]
MSSEPGQQEPGGRVVAEPECRSAMNHMALANMAPANMDLSCTPPTPARASFLSLGSLSPVSLSPTLSKRSSSPGKQPPAGSTLTSPTHSLMTSPKLWQKASISRLAEEFFWIGGSVVAQPKWRLGQIIERCMCTMQTGSQMVKLKGKKKGLMRFFYLDEHKSCIRWRPSRKHNKAKNNRFDPNCCFSIYYGERVKSLDLVSTNGEEARTWITGLKYLMAGISDEDCLARRQRTRDQYPPNFPLTFSEADKNGDGTLSMAEVHLLLHKLNVNLPRQKVREMFKLADTDENQGSLGFEEFCSFYKMMSTRRDLYLIMISYSNQKEFMDLNDIARFLEIEQKIVGVSREHLVEIVSHFEPCPENLQHMVLGIDGFTNYMRSPAGDIFNPEHHMVNQDMTQPLCNYYISTSHNTYLTGDQFLSQSRVDMYAYVLQAGCRCVEVDCWDGPDGEPIIHHGYTLTSKILFKDVIETINKYAFTKSQYPVILSIENHCTVPQQKKMAQYLTEVLQDKVDLSTVNMNECRKLPSPEILKGKVLVKDENGTAAGTQPKRKKQFCRSILRSFKPYVTSWQVSSLNETVMNQILQLKPGELVRFNQRQLLRVYPSNYRVDSSNFNPQPFWNTGCHMGAFNPVTEDPLPGQRKAQLVVKIISGQQLPKPKDSVFGDRGEIIDPFVEVEIIGLPVDCSKEQTRVVDDNGFNPMWEETLVFNIQMAQIALVRFQVKSNAVQAAKQHLKNAAKKHIKGHHKQHAVDISVLSSEDGHPHHFPRDADSYSQDSRQADLLPGGLGPAAKAAFHKGAMSEPVKRIHRAEIQPPEARRGIFSRMSSTVSSSGVTAACARQNDSDLESLSQMPRPDTSDLVTKGPPQATEPQPDPSEHIWVMHQDNPIETPVLKALGEGPEPSNALAISPQLAPETQATVVFTQPQHPEHPLPLKPLEPCVNPSFPLPPPIPPNIPPPSPARVRRTLEAPQNRRPSSPIRTKARSQSCPRRRTTSPHTPSVNRKPAIQWQKPLAEMYASYSHQVRPIPNGLCLSDSVSSSDASTDSLELMPSCVPAHRDQREGTLQREMNALFDQKMREIRCKSPILFSDEL